MHRILAPTLALALAAGTAQAAFVSFASDTEDQRFTFSGFGGNIPPSFVPDSVDLLFDDENGPLPERSIQALFNPSFFFSHVTSTDLGGGLFQHSYTINGSFKFSDSSLGDLLSINFNSAVFNISGTQSTWGSSGGINGSDAPLGLANVTYTVHDALFNLFPDANDYGIFSGSSTGIDDFAFTLTALQDALGNLGGISLDSNFLPDVSWQSEGSFSGRFVTVPAPAAPLLLLGATACRRRRRTEAA